MHKVKIAAPMTFLEKCNEWHKTFEHSLDRPCLADWLKQEGAELPKEMALMKQVQGVTYSFHPKFGFTMEQEERG